MCLQQNWPASSDCSAPLPRVQFRSRSQPRMPIRLYRLLHRQYHALTAKRSSANTQRYALWLRTPCCESDSTARTNFFPVWSSPPKGEHASVPSRRRSRCQCRAQTADTVLRLSTSLFSCSPLAPSTRTALAPLPCLLKPTTIPAPFKLTDPATVAAFPHDIALPSCRQQLARVLNIPTSTLFMRLQANYYERRQHHMHLRWRLPSTWAHQESRGEGSGASDQDPKRTR